MAALCYAAFAFLKIPIPTPGGGMVALHIGNAFCVLAALYLGGVYGGLAGAIGMTIADLMDPKYVTSAPKTFVLKFLIGLIAGFIAHKLGHITADHDRKYLFFWTLLASAVALGFNVIADPIVGYLYKTYLLGIPQEASKIMATWAAGVTAINSVAGTVVVVIAYAALRPVLKKAGQHRLHFRRTRPHQRSPAASCRLVGCRGVGGCGICPQLFSDCQTGQNRLYKIKTARKKEGRNETGLSL